MSLSLSGRRDGHFICKYVNILLSIIMRNAYKKRLQWEQTLVLILRVEEVTMFLENPLNLIKELLKA